VGKIAAQAARGAPRDPEPERALGYAREYDAWFDAPWGRYAFDVESRALLKALGPTRGRTVLDAGCGSGRFSARLLREGATVVGFDSDPAMLHVGAERLRAPLVVADAHLLPFADATFDLTVAVTLCEFVTHADRVVTELARVTGAGGRVVVGALNRASPWGIAHRRRFRRSPWDTARFFRWDELLALGAPHPRTRISAALYAPGDVPGLRLVGPILEGLRRGLPRLGAFRVMTIDLPDPPNVWSRRSSDEAPLK